jgi:predicted RecA/RadA family phage recombinase
MLNELYQDRPGNAMFFACPSSILAGDLVLIGTLPAVAVDDYNAANGGTTFRFSGTFELTVVAATVVSPITGSAVKPGDHIYATGTTDSATNVVHALTLSKATGGTKVGSYAGTGITSGATDTAAPVKLKENAA